MKYSNVMSILVLIVIAMVACTPNTPPLTTPSPSAPSPVVTDAGSPGALTPEDVAWAKTVEAAKKEGLVTIYSTAFQSDISRRITQDFKNKFGIQVEILVGGGLVLKEKIIAENKMNIQIADVSNSGGTGNLADLVRSGLAMRIATELPALRDKKVFKVDPVYSPDGDMLTWNIKYSGMLAINTKSIKAQEEPRSYKDLLLPRWKGQFVSNDPRDTSGTTGFYYVPRYYKVVDLDYYRQLAKQDVKLWGSNSREP